MDKQLKEQTLAMIDQVVDEEKKNFEGYEPEEKRAEKARAFLKDCIKYTEEAETVEGAKIYAQLLGIVMAGGFHDLFNAPERDMEKFGMGFYGINPFRVFEEDILKRAEKNVQGAWGYTFFGKDSQNATLMHNIKKTVKGLQTTQGELDTKEKINKALYQGYMKSWRRYYVLPHESAGGDTAYTDGRAIYINPYFIESLPPDGITFVLCHELMHVLFEHLDPKKEWHKFISTGNPETRGMAMNLLNHVTDCEINDTLTKDFMSMGVQFIKDDVEMDIDGFKPFYIRDFNKYRTDQGIIVYSNLMSRLTMQIFESVFNGYKATPIKEAETVSEAKANMDKVYSDIMAFVDQHSPIDPKSLNMPSQMPKDPAKLRDFLDKYAGELLKNKPNGYTSLDETYKRENSLAFSDYVELALARYSVYNALKQLEQILNPQKDQAGPGQGGKKKKSSGGMPQMGQGGGKEQNDEDQEVELTKDQIKQIIKDLLSGDNNVTKDVGSHSATETKIKANGKDLSSALEEIATEMDMTTGQVMEDIKRKITDDMEKIRQAGHFAGKMNQIYMARRLKRKQPWDDMVTKTMRKVKGYSNKTYKKFNSKTQLYRKITGKSICIPSNEDVAGRIMVAIDTSGSIYSDEASMTKGLGEILRLANTVMKQHPDFEIDIVMCDTKIAEHYKFSGNSSKFRSFIADLKEHGLEVKGGGGTDLLPVFKMIEAEKKDPFTSLIFITDTQSMNTDIIADLYRENKITTPTVIIYPPSENGHLDKHFKELATETSLFKMSEMPQLAKSKEINDYGMDR